MSTHAITTELDATAEEVPHTTLEEVTIEDGGQRQIVHRINAAGIAALRERAGQLEVHLVRQHRIPFGEELVEIAAGVLDVPGETPQQAAVRELGEEAGLRTATTVALAHLYPTPGYSDEQVFVYAGWDTAEVDAQPESTDAGSHWWSLDDALTAIDRGDIRDAKTVIALLLISRHQRTLLARMRTSATTTDTDLNKGEA